jgi:hypothetical protein
MNHQSSSGTRTVRRAVSSIEKNVKHELKITTSYIIVTALQKHQSLKFKVRVRDLIS